MPLIFERDVKLIKGSGSEDGGTLCKNFVQQFEDGGLAETVWAMDDRDASVHM
jgi:hypothetical protein